VCDVTLHAFEFERRNGGKYLCLRRRSLWFAGQLHDLVVAGHVLLDDCQLGWAEICQLYRARHSVLLHLKLSLTASHVEDSFDIDNRDLAHVVRTVTIRAYISAC